MTSTRNVELARSIRPDEVIDYTKEDFTKRGHRHDVLFDIGGKVRSPTAGVYWVRAGRS